MNINVKIALKKIKTKMSCTFITRRYFQIKITYFTLMNYPVELQQASTKVVWSIKLISTFAKDNFQWNSSRNLAGFLCQTFYLFKFATQNEMSKWLVKALADFN